MFENNRVIYTDHEGIRVVKNLEQPSPQARAESEPVYQAFLARLEARKAKGLETYGKELTTFNGRRSLEDALDEASDLCMYLQQAIMERDALVSRVEQLLSLLKGGK